MATTAITEDTPMRMPSTVRNERSLLARSEATAMRDGFGERHLRPRFSSSLSILPVADVDRAVGVLGDVALVGDEDDRVARRRAASRTGA